MKKSVLSMLIAGIFLVASAGFAQAYMDEPRADDISTDPTQMEASRLVPYNPGDFEGSWQFEGPVETGYLPPGEDLSQARSGFTADFPLFESGGVLFREGIDTQ